jgi:hypothetical protein
MPVDFVWQSFGGCLLDSTGDLAVTASNAATDVQSIVQSRLKSAVNGWKLYTFGADLETVVGESVQAEIDTALQRSVISALTSDGFLDSSALDVIPLNSGAEITVLVYLNSQLIAQAGLANPQTLLAAPTS